ncbi:MAG: hypothetical protein IT208_13205 [Chthonomonadales bacterium]|nr:hypothetical protein [Chthonomonadales bacterium]
MRFPKERVRFARIHDGHAAPNGYLVLDLRGLDIEGVASLVLDMDEVSAAQGQGDREAEARRQLRDLFGE